MSADYSREMLKITVAKMLQTLGWNSVNTTPVEILTDILKSYLCHLAKLTNDYATQYNSIEPNLDHLGLAFRDLNVDLVDLEEYIKYVDFGQNPNSVPKYPVPKEDHLNFLKPGSKEVVTRPVHIHEHMPPMAFGAETSETENEVTIKTEEPDDMAVETAPVFKRPSDVSPGDGLGFNKRAKFAFEEEGRPTREISSVMMTTSGYLSPAREGKLPESRTPLAAVDPVLPVNPVSIPPEQPTSTNARKPGKVVKKVDKKKEKVGKELFKPIHEDGTPPPKPKKTPTMKDVAKSKQVKPANNILPPGWNNILMNNEVRISPVPNVATNSPTGRNQSNKINKALQAARLKTEKLNTTITPIPMKPTIPENIDKLFTEPDKKKVNIFKKISNVKNEKSEPKTAKVKDDIKQESRESSPDLIIDESASDSVVNRIHRISNDITIEVIDAPPSVNKSPDKLERWDSPPGTPGSTPKTPEMISQSPPLSKEKRRRKDKTRIKKVPKQQHHISPPRSDPDLMEIDMDRPKTPDPMKPDLPIPPMSFPFPFTAFNTSPGLIPAHPFISPMTNQLLNLPAFGQSPYINPVMNHFHHLVPPLGKHDEPQMPVVHKPVVDKPVVSLPPAPSPTAGSTVPVQSSDESLVHSTKPEKKSKEHKREKKDKIKKKNKKDKNKDKAEKKKLKEEKKDKEKMKKEKKERKKEKELRDGESAVPKITLKIGAASPLPVEQADRKLNIKPVIKKEEEEDIKHSIDIKREMSPELAKISALVTGQPKTKAVNQQPIPPLISNDTFPSSSTDTLYTPKKNVFKPIPKLRTKDLMRPPETIAVSSVDTPSKYIDSEGNEVWICPACGQQDDGSPMIGCDDCDAWYHWFCVGIQVPPDDNENWYCRLCIVKKQEVLQSDKKKKRKKREKKEH